MNQDERDPIALEEYRHRRRPFPRPTFPPPPPFRPSAILRQFIHEVVVDALHEHVQELHTGRAS